MNVPFVAHDNGGGVPPMLGLGAELVRRRHTVRCLPLGCDQPFNAGRVEAIGAGLTLPPESASAAIAEAVMTLLRDGSFREAAGRAAVQIASMGPGAVNGADIVERIGARGR